MSLTGANADQWVPVKPGTEGVLALGLAHVISRTSCGRRRRRPRRRRRGRLGGRARRLRAGEVEQITGVTATRVDRLARELAASAPAVAIIGGAPLAQTNGLFHALAVNALNALVGTVGQPGGIFFTPGVQPPVPGPQP